MGLDGLGVAFVIGEVSETVGADRHDEHATESHLRQRVEELPDLGGVVRGERLLALIDDEQRASHSEIEVAQGVDRMLAGRHNGDLDAAREELRTDPGPDE